jgi:hypothetical protein
MAAGRAGVPNPAYTSLQSIKAERAGQCPGAVHPARAVQAGIAHNRSADQQSDSGCRSRQRINRDYDVLKQQYDKLLQDREELRLRGRWKTEHNSVRFQVIDPPTTRARPWRPTARCCCLAS